MSLQMTMKVWEDKSITDREELLVMLALADSYNPKHGCFPDLEAIAEKARITKRGVIRVINRLVTKEVKQSPTDFSEKTISYAIAKTAYFNALRDAVPELMAIATGKEARSPELDRFSDAFLLAGDRQEKAANDATEILLERFHGNPDVERARAAFDRAQAVEENSIMISIGWVSPSGRRPWRFAYLLRCDYRDPERFVVS